MHDRRLIIGNWKMQLDINGSIALAQGLRTAIEDYGVPQGMDMVVCPSVEALAAVADILQGSPVVVGAQDVFWQERGAYTGEVSASMLRACGAELVIIGHSERRKYLREDDVTVNRKVRAALAQDLVPIVCVGETYDQRRAGHTDLILMRQVIEGLKGIPVEQRHRIVIAYEPVWVIGTGQAIEPSMAAHASDVIHQALIDLFPGDVVERQTMLLYGGSVDAKNISSFMELPRIQGALVGTASLTVEKFLGLIHEV